MTERNNIVKILQMLAITTVCEVDITHNIKFFSGEEIIDEVLTNNYLIEFVEKTKNDAKPR